jgi:tRNA A37 threonylcarbamoyladenosine dehydratase
MLHRFSRTEILIGPQGLRRLAAARVAVFGLGGVGSHVAEALCRAGVGRLTLVDFDTVCVSNINRQLLALDDTVGRPKALVMAERLGRINPVAEIIPVQEAYGPDTSQGLLAGSFDYVVDAIDTMTAKVHLIAACRQRQIPVISSMGAAFKRDPSRIRIGDISETRCCPMARAMRKLLRREGITSGVTVVYSTEEFREPAERRPSCRRGCNCPDSGDPSFPCPHRRVVLGSISFMPPLFGYSMAGVVVNDLLTDR